MERTDFGSFSRMEVLENIFHKELRNAFCLGTFWF